MPRRKKTPKVRSGSRTRISVDTYNKMWNAYKERQTTEHVRKQAGVIWATADKYITHGDPTRGLESIRERFAKAMQRAARLDDYSLAKARRSTLGLVTAYKERLKERIEQMALDEMSTAIGNEIDRIARLEEDLLGRPEPADEKIETMIEGWTEEEMDEFARTGKWPDRAEGESATRD